MTRGVKNQGGESTRDVDGVRDLLRAVQHPGISRDIVSAGYIRKIDIKNDAIEVQFAPNTTDPEKVTRMEQEMRDVLYGAAFFDVQIHTVQPFDDDSMLMGGGTLNPLQAEMLEDGETPQGDPLRDDLRRADDAPEAGYGEEGPQPFEGPRGPATMTYDGELPVFQWDIDPHDSEAENHEAEVKRDGWDFRVWWQVHPRGDLAYVSLQAMREDWVDHVGEARTHPVGRSEAVNLVYDMKRNGIVALYGTVPDFRPFVEAFGQAWFDKTGSNPWSTTGEEDK